LDPKMKRNQVSAVRPLTSSHRVGPGTSLRVPKHGFKIGPMNEREAHESDFGSSHADGGRLQALHCLAMIRALRLKA
jgi:hypothetical protein